ncbi:MAG: ergothioneine biosynthesis protein EgtB [Actinobacteria bacterium]|nr:ergothioneine biosynthesis protein EgtB [Actinomycetota bacterium]
MTVTGGAIPSAARREQIVAELGVARARTLALLDPLAEDDLTAQHSPLMSPLVWDLAHIAHYEELWLVRALSEAGATDPRLDDVYDAFRHPRAERPTLDLLGPGDARDFAAHVRKRALDLLAEQDLAGTDPLVAEGFVYGMVLRHEHQHDETMLATIQLMAEGRHPAAGGGPGAPGRPIAAAEVAIEAGPFVMGTDTDPWAYDNERPRLVVDLPAYRIDTTPVTNEAFAAFVADGGYEEPRWWDPAGWAWRQQATLEHPLFWLAEGDEWARRRFGRIEGLPPREPVQHVCWYEADAYARWCGKRLPTEAEWEKAAAWDPRGRSALTHPMPWGDAPATAALACLLGCSDGEGRFGPDEVGAHPEGVSAWGCHDMVGGVWEWTASDFSGYPGFAAFPYREYSEVFFGTEYKVLRGGSWATHPSAISTTFRNWDLPVRRQIFAGFRCAADA